MARDTLRTSNRWRRWPGGPKHGIALGVAVWGTPGFAEDADALNELLGRWPMLESWAESHDFPLTSIQVDLPLLKQDVDLRLLDQEIELRLLDQEIDLWLLDEAVDQPPPGGDMTALAGEVGRFLGTVIIRTGTGARWRVWPNGHPVIRTVSGRELDVFAMASSSVSGDGPWLADIYADAVAAGKARLG
ncbi:MAG: hypothetical protein J2P28_07160 [Actinobacteria bacterium]|nr:hypothetical protein [Actinomycetota bacterium]MBO0835283.1 hypothetical protein [Actinomycetota bacterium]